jgi:hypothetical protein
VYPLLPGQIELILRITSVLRTRSSRAQGDDQAIRGLLQLLGELAIAQQDVSRLKGELAFKDEVLEDVVHESLARFKTFVASFDDPDQPYLSKPHVLFLDSPGDYDHLARVKEWSSGGGE